MAAFSKDLIANPHVPFDVEIYLAEEQAKDLLRFSTAGSVDDGKSTLIGRLLYDTQNVYDDQVRSIEGKGSAGVGQLDLALLTDGLRAEREQGITIDVAYRYFATKRRKFIIADTPGHEQYTRNMATGSSTADVAIVLVDARKGVLVQSRRHAYIAALLGVPHVIVAINKMDLVDYAEQTYTRILTDFEQFFSGLEEHNASALHFVPVSALAGDNVARSSEQMPWYTGPTLLALLESIPATERAANAPFRFAVQRVLRPHQNFRGFAGQISAGTVRPGDAVHVLPSGRSSTVRSIVTFDGDLDQATAPLSVCITLEDEIDISRGDMLVAPAQPASLARSFTASLVWMDVQPLALTRRYLLKHTSRTVQASVRAIRYSVDVADLSRTHATTLQVNGIGLVEIETVQPLMLDLYAANRHTGSFVLIDAETNATVAAGMVRELLADTPPGSLRGPVTPDERARRWGHTAAHLALTGTPEYADAVERALLENGAIVFRCGSTDTRLQQAILQGGGIALTLVPVTSGSNQARIGKQATPVVTNTSLAESVDAVLALLRTTGILHAQERPGND
jgi:sulfate adenylyltransferase large subunit